MITIRLATPADAAACAEIYSPYVKNTGITFEVNPPDSAEFATRITNTLKSFPWLVACQGQKVVGYAYAHQFGERAAFCYSCELSVYVDNGCKGQGVGKMLYQYLLNVLKQQCVRRVYALIAVPDEGSIAFHIRMGFEKAGTLPNIGYKLGRWWGLCYMQKNLGLTDDALPKPRKMYQI